VLPFAQRLDSRANIFKTFAILRRKLPRCELLHHVKQSLHSFLGLRKNRAIVDETYVIKLIAVVSVLTAVILVLANLQTMTEPLILPSRREHPQQSIDEDVQQLRGRDASLRYTSIKRDCCTFCIVWSQTDSCAVVNLIQ